MVRMNTVIETRGLSKQYRQVKAVDDLDLHVGKGEIYGFLGLNGAGKSTTIRMLLGMIAPSAGSAFIHGKKVHAGHNALWKRVGYMVEIPYSYSNLTVEENLEIIRRLRGISDREAVSRIIRELRLQPYSRRKAKHLSQGNAQRLGLAKALIHHPDILILDEPTNSLDPAGIYEVRQMLKNLAENIGVTIFISSHILGEIAKTATRIGIIHHGRLIREFNADELDKLYKKELHVKAREMDHTQAVLEQKFRDVKMQNGRIVINDPHAIEEPDIVSEYLVTSGCPPQLLQVNTENLESYFLRVIDDKSDTIDSEPVKTN